MACRQLLYHWCVLGNTYRVYLGKKRNSKQKLVDTLRKKTEWHMPDGCKFVVMAEVKDCYAILTDRVPNGGVMGCFEIEAVHDTTVRHAIIGRRLDLCLCSSTEAVFRPMDEQHRISAE